jgi:hypothetical protein
VSESGDQQALFQWAAVQVALGTYPELEMLMHIPNGEKRDKHTAAKLQRMGVRAGVPDVLLPLARGKYHSLWIEMKAARGRVSTEQGVWHSWLIHHGHKVHLAYGWEDAARAIVDYMNLLDNRV